MTYLFSNTISGNVSIYNSNGAAITSDKPLPVTLGSNSITITGNVNVSTVVQVNSTPENPVHTHLSEVGNSGILQVPYLPVGGNVSIFHSNSASITAAVPLPITGSVTTIGGSAQGKLWTLQVSQGLIAGHTTEQVTGYNPATSAGDAVWSGGTAYPWSSLTTAQTLYLKSSTNNVTDRGMSILIDGLDSNYVNQTEVLTLNASDSRTPVVSTKQFLRIHHVMCNGANTNDGDITTHVTSGTGTVVSKITSGRGAAKAGVYTVPAGYTGYLYKGDASSTGATVVNFMGRYFGKAFMVLHVAIVDNSTYIYDFPFPLVLPEKTDLYTVIEVGAGKTAINYELLLVAN